MTGQLPDQVADRVTHSRLTIGRWVIRYRIDLLVFFVACLWFLPGLWWGLPHSSAVGRMAAWAPDELAPRGAINTLLALWGEDITLTPQYPLGHPLIQSLFVWPYRLVTLAADNVGLPPMTESLAMLTVLHRLPSVLAGAGTVVVARRAGRLLGGDPAGWLAAAAVAVSGPLLYYARTSNVDAAALFWSALGTLIAIDALRHGLTIRRAILLGLTAAIGTATKDQQYAYFVGIGVVLLPAHFVQHRGTTSWWEQLRVPLAGLAVGGAVYLAMCGILFLPTWFGRHLEFIGGAGKRSSEAVTVARASYFANPPTLRGYLHVFRDTGSLMLAAVGLPVAGLAITGFVIALRRDRRLWALLVAPTVGILIGVLGVVRFVRPRFLLSTEFVACLFAAYAVARSRHWPAPWHRVVRSVAVLGIVWIGVHDIDLTVQMVRDGRYRAAEWIARNVRVGDTVAYFGAPGKLPRMPAHTVVTPAPGQMVYDAKPTTESPHFIVSIPQQPTEPIHEWSVPDSTYRRLYDGTAGYRLVAAIQTPAIWPRPLLVASYVNAPVRIFARNDVARRLQEPPWIEVEDPY